MNLFTSKNHLSPDVILKKYFNELQLWRNEENEIDILVQLVNAIRPRNPKKSEQISLFPIIEFFTNNNKERINFVAYLQTVLQSKNFDAILTDAGILQDTDFFYEVKKRVFAKVLPYQAPKDTLQYVLNQVFYVDSDPVWINKIPKSELETLFELFQFETIYENVAVNSPLYEVMQAINLLSQRTSGKALESDVMKMVPEYAGLESPFAAFEKELYAIENTIRNKESEFYTTSSDINYKQLLVLYKQCNEFVEKAFQNSSKYGISLRVNQNLLRIKQQLYRVGVLMPLLVVDKPEDKKAKSIELAIKLIKYNCLKTNVRKLFNESTQLLSYEITQHTAKTGEHYITESKTEYFK
ncbi:MAG: recombinase, partial [Flavobacterium sp.]